MQLVQPLVLTALDRSRKAASVLMIDSQIVHSYWRISLVGGTLGKCYAHIRSSSNCRARSPWRAEEEEEEE